MRQVIECHNGRVFKTVGDAFCAAFSNAEDAALAAIECQKRLDGLIESSHGPLSVRVGLHAGASEIRDGDFFGSSVNKAARIVALANGGQIIASGATFELLKPASRLGVGFVELGEFDLRGFNRPERLYQLTFEGLRSTFPPLKGGKSTPNNLKPLLTSFVGRENDLSQLLAAMKRSRLVTLTGSGGSGKTRLALESAGCSLGSFPDGVWLVELNALTEDEEVPLAAFEVLGIQPERGVAPLESLAHHFHDKKCLLVLDNCEHLLIGAARLADTLLSASSELQVLATSREALNLPGEIAFRIPSMSLPPEGEHLGASELEGFDAVRLFLVRAQEADPTFVANDADMTHVVHVCRRLDGIPLALELAAARLRTMHIAQLAERLNDRFRILTGGSRTAVSRQRTLRALIDWSFDLLSEPERLTLCCLSTFLGGWDLEAAEAVVGDGAIRAEDVLEHVVSLVEKSMVVRCPPSGGASRYTMLETVRHYAAEKLADMGEAAAARDRHLQFFRGLFDHPALQEMSEESPRVFGRLRDNSENIRAAFIWALERDPSLAIEWGSQMSTYFHGTQRIVEGADLLGQAFKQTESEGPTKTRLEALMLLATLEQRKGDSSKSLELALRAQEMAAVLGDGTASPNIASMLGSIALGSGDYTKALDIFRDLTELGRRLPDQQVELLGVYGSMLASRALGDFDTMLERLREAEELCVATGSVVRQIWLVSYKGSYFEESGNLLEATRWYAEALGRFAALGPNVGICWHWECLARIFGSVGMEEPAAYLFGGAAKQRLVTGWPAEPTEARRNEASLARVRTALGSEFDRHYREGSAANASEITETALKLAQGILVPDGS